LGCVHWVQNPRAAQGPLLGLGAPLRLSKVRWGLWGPGRRRDRHQLGSRLRDTDARGRSAPGRQHCWSGDSWGRGHVSGDVEAPGSCTEVWGGEGGPRAGWGHSDLRTRKGEQPGRGVFVGRWGSGSSRTEPGWGHSEPSLTREGAGEARSRSRWQDGGWGGGRGDTHARAGLVVTGLSREMSVQSQSLRQYFVFTFNVQINRKGTLHSAQPRATRDEGLGGDAPQSMREGTAGVRAGVLVTNPLREARMRPGRGPALPPTPRVDPGGHAWWPWRLQVTVAGAGRGLRVGGVWRGPRQLKGTAAARRGPAGRAEAARGRGCGAVPAAWGAREEARVRTRAPPQRPRGPRGPQATRAPPACSRESPAREAGRRGAGVWHRAGAAAAPGLRARRGGGCTARGSG
jgi:hypothetical protein